MIGEPFQSASFEGLPPIAVPITVKMPDPMTAPMPSAVSETGPSVFFRACSGRSESEISLSIDFVRKICLASALSCLGKGGAGRSLLQDVYIRLVGRIYTIHGRSGESFPRRFARGSCRGDLRA
jgi:hypothetical protein